MPRLKAELLDLPRPPYPSEIHNIFGAPPPPPPPPPSAARPAGPVGAAAAAPPPPPPPDPFVEEAKQLRFVGYLRTGSALTAFIVRGQEIHSLDVGNMLQGRYKVQAITEDEVVLASPQGDKQVRLAIVPAGTAGRPAPPAPTPTPPRGFIPPAAGAPPAMR